MEELGSIPFIRDIPQNPYLKVECINWLIVRLKPRDPRLLPDQFVPDEDQPVVDPNTGREGRYNLNSVSFFRPNEVVA
jgi:hypothetical protein